MSGINACGLHHLSQLLAIDHGEAHVLHDIAEALAQGVDGKFVPIPSLAPPEQRKTASKNPGEECEREVPSGISDRLTHSGSIKALVGLVWVGST